MLSPSRLGCVFKDFNASDGDIFKDFRLKLSALQNDHFSMKTGRAFCDAQMESNNPFQEQCRCKTFYDPKTEDCPFFVGGCTDCGSDKSETISN